MNLSTANEMLKFKYKLNNVLAYYWLNYICSIISTKMQGHILNRSYKALLNIKIGSIYATGGVSEPIICRKTIY